MMKAFRYFIYVLAFTAACIVLRSQISFFLNQESSDGNAKSTIAASSSSSSTKQSPTIVVQLSGELGNHLGKLATGFAVQLWLQQEFSLNSTLVLRHQDGVSKWVRATSYLQQCFPSLRDFNYAQGNTDEFTILKGRQELWLGKETLHLHTGNAQDIQKVLETFTVSTQQSERPSFVSNTKSKTNISLPFLLADWIAGQDILVDRFYDHLTTIMAFDDDECCDLLPFPDEAVFHFRDFIFEMGAGKQKGYAEIEPQQLSSELLAHLKPLDKVAVVTRFAAHADPYVQALEQRGLRVRVVSQPSAMQDFCFLMKAQVLVGAAHSTFVFWAGMLGKVPRLILYSLNSTERRALYGPHDVWRRYDYQHPELRSRIEFRLIQGSRDS